MIYIFTTNPAFEGELMTQAYSGEAKEYPITVPEDPSSFFHIKAETFSLKAEWVDKKRQVIRFYYEELNSTSGRAQKYDKLMMRAKAVSSLKKLPKKTCLEQNINTSFEKQ